MTITASAVGVDEIQDLLREMPDHLFDETKKEVARTLFTAQKKMAIQLKSGANGIQTRTGNLLKSIKFNLSGTKLKDLHGELYTDSPYAPIHETGGRITAKNAYKSLQGGPFLNIPSNFNKTKVGITRLTARSVFLNGGYIIKIKAPKAQYAVMLDGTPMFWLVKSVELQPRLKMVETTTDEVPTLLSNLNDVLLKGL